jgi:NADP-dependent 3-hydroxy acid dehydrogenase YdfG
MSGIQEKVVAITGASSDIGEAAARLLAERGAKVMLGALRIGRLNALAHEIVQAGGSAHYQALDVTQPKSMQCFIDEATEVFGHVDVIVHAASLAPPVHAREWAGDCRQIATDAIARTIVLAIEQPGGDVGPSEIKLSSELVAYCT